jgi:hypothetical protein
MQSLKNSLNDLRNNVTQSDTNSFLSNTDIKPISSLTQKPSTRSSIISNPVQTLSSFSDKVSSAVKKPVDSVLKSKTLESMPSTDGSSIFSNIKFFVFILAVILLLAFLGFNIFQYLAEGTDFTANLIAPFTKVFAYLTGDTIKTTTEQSEIGTNEITETAAKTTKNIVSNASKGIVGGVDKLKSSLKKDKKTIVETENNNFLIDKQNEEQPEPIRTSSLEQGYCYIGKVNDTRYCAKVDARSKCMSGDIYPSIDICINPNLRN